MIVSTIISYNYSLCDQFIVQIWNFELIKNISLSNFKHNLFLLVIGYVFKNNIWTNGEKFSKILVGFWYRDVFVLHWPGCLVFCANISENIYDIWTFEHIILPVYILKNLDAILKLSIWWYILYTYSYIYIYKIITENRHKQ